MGNHDPIERFRISIGAFINKIVQDGFIIECYGVGNGVEGFNGYNHNYIYIWVDYITCDL